MNLSRSIEMFCDAGLCNRLRVLDSCLILARELDRPLMVYWPLNDNFGGKFTELFIDNIPGVSFEYCYGSILKTPSLVPKLKEKTGIASVLEHNLKHYFNTEVSRERKTHIFDKLRKCKTIQINTVHRFLYPEDFTFLRPLQKLLSSIANTSSSFDQHTVGLHIRRGDHLTAIQNSPLEGFTEQMRIRLATKDKTKFFLATDDRDVKSQLIDLFGQALITCEQPLSRVSADGAASAVIDLFCLAKTREIWGSKGSSFSETAHHLGKGTLKFIQGNSLVARC